MTISTLLAQIDLGAIALPEFQRGYVWNRDQVRGLMDSLYRGYPVGSLLMWKTYVGTATTRGDTVGKHATVDLLLDGQQRLTSLYGIIKGEPPKFFDGNQAAFTGLYFNIESEAFEFYAPLKMGGDPRWINVTELMRTGIGPHVAAFWSTPELADKAADFTERLNRLVQIQQTNLYIDQVSGDDKSLDIVVEIFNKVNSGGTKLSKGDLALAKVCAGWREARVEMKKRLAKWQNAGFNFDLDWMMRCTNAATTGESYYTALNDVSMEEFKAGLATAEERIDFMLNLVAARLGLDHDRVLGSRYSFPLLVGLMKEVDLRRDQRAQSRILYWFIHTLLWGRYSASTESVLAQDLTVVRAGGDAIDNLIAGLRKNRGDLRIQPADFDNWSVSARFYPLMYMLTRVWHARDWGNGIELRNNLLGRLTSLQLHHIFPKDLLYKAGYERAEVNALANFAFLTQGTNLEITNRDPAEYLPKYATMHLGALESHWIPMDPDLWKIERYREFLAERRRLLANAANEFLDALLAGKVEGDPDIEVATRLAPGSIATSDEERVLDELNAWVVAQGLPAGTLRFEIVAEGSTEPEAVLDLAWPVGLQAEFSKPVAVLLDESSEVEEAANRAGFQYFTSVDEFKAYVEREVLALAELGETVNAE